MAWEAANPAANPSASSCSTISGLRKPCNSTNASSFKKSNLHTKNVTKELDFQVLTLDEIRKNRARRIDSGSGMDNRSSNISSQTELLINSHSNQRAEDYKSHLGITDLRSKLSLGKNANASPDNSKASDSVSSKRQRQISPQSGPKKKQRIRLHRLSEMIGDKETGKKFSRCVKDEEKVYAELGSDNNFLGDIDKLLMELE